MTRKRTILALCLLLASPVAANRVVNRGAAPGGTPGELILVASDTLVLVASDTLTLEAGNNVLALADAGSSLDMADAGSSLTLP